MKVNILKFIRFINKLVIYGFFVLGIVLLFYPTGRMSTPIIAFGTFICSVIVGWFLKYKKIDEKYWFVFNLALLLNLLGEVGPFYQGLLFYDKIIHLLLGFLLSGAVYEYYKRHSGLKKDAVFLTVMGLLAVWEIYEYTLDTFFGFQAQGVIRNNVFVQIPLDDTMYDLIMGALGSLAFLFLKKEKVDVVIKEKVDTLKEYAKTKKKRINFKPFLKSLFSFR